MIHMSDLRPNVWYAVEGSVTSRRDLIGAEPILAQDVVVLDVVLRE